MTEQYLNSQNKAALVALVLSLNVDLENYKTGPLKASDVEKKILELAKQVTDTQSLEEDKKRKHIQELAKLDNEKELAKRKLELEYESSRGISAQELLDIYKELEEKAKINKDDLSFGLKRTEIEIEQKIEAANTALVEAETAFEEKKASLAKEIDDLKLSTAADKANVKKEHERTMEQVKYDNSIALRDENIDTATKIAAKHGFEVISGEELEKLQKVEAINEDTVKAAVGKAEGILSSRLKKEYEAELKDKENAATLSKSLLEKDKEYLQKSLTAAELRISELSAQIKEFPTQLKEAVEAAKADISISQDATGKK